MAYDEILEMVVFGPEASHAAYQQDALLSHAAYQQDALLSRAAYQQDARLIVFGTEARSHAAYQQDALLSHAAYQQEARLAVFDPAEFGDILRSALTRSVEVTF